MRFPKLDHISKKTKPVTSFPGNGRTTRNSGLVFCRSSRFSSSFGACHFPCRTVNICAQIAGLIVLEWASFDHFLRDPEKFAFVEEMAAEICTRVLSIEQIANTRWRRFSIAPLCIQYDRVHRKTESGKGFYEVANN